LANDPDLVGADSGLSRHADDPVRHAIGAESQRACALPSGLSDSPECRQLDVSRRHDASQELHLAGARSLKIDALSQAGTAYAVVEGCVASGVFTPRQATVGAVSADGRLLGTSSTNQDGVFVLQVPINTQVEVSVLEPGGYAIELAVGTQPIVLTACLRVDAAG
jgi:hypothetical protein